MANTGTTKRRSVRNTRLTKEQRDDLSQRVRQMLNHEIDFIPSQEFRSASAAKEILDGKVDSAQNRSIADAPRDFPAHLARLCETQLLSADEERELFRLMNYCKFRANAIRTQLDSDRPDAELLHEAWTRLAVPVAALVPWKRQVCLPGIGRCVPCGEIPGHSDLE